MQAVDSIDELLRRTLARTVEIWEPPEPTVTEKLLRELAVDGGRKPKGLSSPYLTVRVKYALEGARCVHKSMHKCPSP
jgi:hypothetical protein